MHGTFGGPSFKRAPATKSASSKKPPPTPKKGSAVKARPPTPTKGKRT